MRAIITAIYNLLFNPNSVNTGGLVPNLGAGAVVTSVKSYAALSGATQTYSELASVVTSTAIGAAWIYAVYLSLTYISGGVHYQGILGFGASGAETNITGSGFRAGHTQATAVGEVMDQQWSYGAWPIYWAAGNRLAAGGSSSNNANDQFGIHAAYRTGLGT
ncbi:MAG: hypothetical protein NTZ05_01930 [Chloroflexi bacterium]|nr:hypothetical protein [Chloroflexota bacterium]